MCRDSNNTLGGCPMDSQRVRSGLCHSLPILEVLINGYREGFCSKHNVNQLIKL